MNERRAGEFVAWGDAAVNQGKFEQAAEHYHRALAITGPNPPLQLKYGDCLYRASGVHPAYAADAARAWEGVHESNPRDLPVLQRLMTYRIDAWESAPSTASAMELRAAAGRIVAVDPHDRRAAAYRHVGELHAWLFGDEPFDARREEPIRALARLVETDRADAVSLYYLARAHVRRGQELRAEGKGSEAARELDRAAALCAGALEGRPDRAGVCFRVSQVYAVMAELRASEYQRRAENPYPALARQAAERAVAAATPHDLHFTDIHVWAAELLARANDRGGAERVYGKALAAEASNRYARLGLARLLGGDAARCAEALALLGEEPTATAEAGKAAVFDPMRPVRPDPAREILVQVALLRLGLCEDPTSAAPRAQRIEAARQACEKAVAAVGEAPVTWKLKVRLAQAQGRHFEAIQVADRAVTSLEIQKLPPDAEILYLKAVSFARVQQPRQAAELLRAALGADDSYGAARLLLARLLVRELKSGVRGGDAAAAREVANELGRHIERLGDEAPGDPEVTVLRIEMATAGPRGGWPADELKRLYGSLPEASHSERLRKARVAVGLDDRDEAVRLLRAALATVPGDPAAAELLARVHLSRGETAAGRAVLDEAALKSPGDARLPLLRKAIDDPAAGTSAAGFARELAMASGDALTREVELGKADLAAGNLTGAVGHFEAARGLAGGDAEKSAPVTELLFQCALRRQDWRAAEGHAADAARSDLDQARGLTYRVRLGLARKDFGDAVAAARELTGELPQLASSWALLGQALQASARGEEADQSYRRALALQPDHAAALRGSIECLRTTGHAEAARAAVGRARKAFPADPAFRELEFELELASGDVEGVVARREVTFREQPDRPENAVLLGRACLAAASGKAATDAAAARRHLDRARDVLSAGVARWPDDRDCAQWAATAALQAGDVDGGERVLRAFAGRDWWKDSPEPARMLADYCDQAGRPDSAEAALRALLEKAPGDTETALRLGELLRQRQKCADAVRVLEPFRRIPAVQRLVTSVLIDAGRPADAEAYLAGVLAEVGRSPDTLGLLAMVYAWERKVGEARKSIEEALALDAKGTYALYARGLLRLQEADPDVDRAIADLCAARDRDPADADLRLFVADAYLRQSNRSAAAAELEAALRFAPGDKRVRLTLMNLCAASVPPQWDRYAKLAAEAQADARLAGDPCWLRAEARMWLARDDTARAAERIARAVALAPGDPGVLRDELDVQLRAADYRAVLRGADRVLAADASADWAHVARARAKRNLGDPAGALGDFDAALSVAEARRDFATAVGVVQAIAREVGYDPALARAGARAKGDGGWRVVIVNLLWNKGDHAAAVAAVDGIMADLESLTPEQRLVALREAANVYANARPPQPEKALGAYTRLVEAAPSDVAALNGLAWLLVEQIAPPRPEEALAYSERAHRLSAHDPSTGPAVADTHGWVLTLAGRASDAIPILERAAGSLADPAVHYHLAEAYLGASQPQAAESQSKAAEDLIAKAERTNAAVDPRLKERLADVSRRAAEMTRARARPDGGTTRPNTGEATSAL